MKPFPRTEKAKAAERVAIAKDVLKQLAAKKIKAKRGEYFYAAVKPKAGELCKLVKGTTCTVCAKGAVFKSMIDRYDRFKLWGDMLGEENSVDLFEDDFYDYIRKLFGGAQIDMIENYFEGFWWKEGAEAWAKRHPSPRKRLRLLMENIIAHKGELVPEALP